MVYAPTAHNGSVYASAARAPFWLGQSLRSIPTPKRRRILSALVAHLQYDVMPPQSPCSGG
jgi:hypothetical protein